MTCTIRCIVHAPSQCLNRCTDMLEPGCHTQDMDQVILSQSDFRRAAGYRLRRAIQACGMSFVSAAKIMGISKTHLGNWMRGEGPIDTYKLYILCRATPITADYVLMDDPSGLPAIILERLLQAEASPELVA